MRGDQVMEEMYSFRQIESSIRGADGMYLLMHELEKGKGLILKFSDGKR